MNWRIIIWLLLLALSAGIIIISIILYNRRLDRVARGEQRDAHSNMPEPRTTASVIYRAALLVLVILIFLSAGTLKSQMDALQTNVASLNSRVNDLSSELRALQERMEEAEKLVSDFSWEVKDADLENGTATVQLSAFLKEYTDETNGFFSVDGKNVPFTVREDGAVSCELSETIFHDLGEVKIVIKDGGKSTVEDLEGIPPLFGSVLPAPRVYITSFNETRSRGKTTSYSGSYGVEVDRNLTDDIQVVNAVYITGGSEVKTADITDKVRNGEPIPIEQGIEIKDYLVLRVDLYTKSGFAIKTRSVLINNVPENGEDPWFMQKDETRVFDQNGALLYTTDGAGFLSVW